MRSGTKLDSLHFKKLSNKRECFVFSGALISVSAIRVSKESRKDITLPFYFICALHLCNEQNLEIEPSCFLGDFKLVSSRK